MHRLSSVDLDAKLADCEECGPGVQIRVDPVRGKRACKGRLRAKGKARRRQLRQQDPWREALKGRSDRTAIIATIEEVEAVAAVQAGRCAICDEEAKLHLDHDHETLRFRGLLCNQCNLGLGQFKDDPKRLKAALLYLANAGA